MKGDKEGGGERELRGNQRVLDVAESLE